MKSADVAMRSHLALRALGLGLLALGLAGAFGGASAQSPLSKAQRSGPSPKVVSRAHQPVGTPHKASSFAPHHTNRRVFGAPIQAPIVRDVAPPKKKPAQPK